jgi:hypothetical protein
MMMIYLEPKYVWRITLTFSMFHALIRYITFIQRTNKYTLNYEYNFMT